MGSERENLLDFIRTAGNVSMDFVEKARMFQGNIYLFGAGNHLPFVVGFMEKYGLPIKGILDSNRPSGFYGSPGKGSHDGDIPIIKFDEFLSGKDAARDCWIVVAAPSVEEEIRETVSRRLPEAEIFSFETFLYTVYFSLQDIEAYRAYLLEHWEEFSSLYDTLADDLSRSTLASVLKGRLTGDLRWFRQSFVPDQYYPDDIICFSKGEVMVELGAYNGETLKQFIRLCPDCRAVYCFEPDVKLLPRLRELAADQAGQGRKVHIIPKGAWDHSTVLSLSCEGTGQGATHVLDDGVQVCGYTIEAAAVDEEVKEPITYMKMDIEGSELRALHGAEGQIRKNRPKLAVCVYHKNEDILEIWNYLRELVPEYRFYLRHHTVTGGETVLYAVSETENT